MSQERYSGKDHFADDALFIDSETTPDDVMSFIIERIENPIVIDDVCIWDFSSYEVDRDALKKAVRTKLQKKRYVIPFQVTGTWGFMFHVLPSMVKEADILVYQPEYDGYNVYQNFYNGVSPEQLETMKLDLARRAHDAQ